MHRNVAADFGKRIDQPGQAMSLALLADLLPVRMVTILQPARGVAADRLEMRIRVRRIAHFGVGRRHRHRVQTLDRAGVADRLAVGANKRIALAPLDAADGQFVLVAELEAEFVGKSFDAGGMSRPGIYGGIGGSGPRSLKILLIRHDLRRLAPTLSS